MSGRSFILKRARRAGGEYKARIEIRNSVRSRTATTPLSTIKRV